MTDSKMDFMSRGPSPLSFTRMESKVNGITIAEIKVKQLDRAAQCRLNMQARAHNSDTKDSSYCLIFKRRYYEFY